MNKTDASQYHWQLVAKADGKQVMAFDCSAEIIGDIVKLIFKSKQGELCSPNEQIRAKMQAVIQKNLISVDTVSRISKIDIDWMNRFLSGEEVTPVQTDKLMLLAEIVDALSE